MWVSLSPIGAFAAAAIAWISGGNTAETSPRKHTRILFGSCNKVQLPQPLWDPITALATGKPASLNNDTEAAAAMEMADTTWVWGGDNVYADKVEKSGLVNYVHQALVYRRVLSRFHQGTPSIFQKLYREQLRHPGYQELLATGIPVVGVWDDHDYGLNDAGSEYKYRAISQQIALDFLGVPGGSGFNGKNVVETKEDGADGERDLLTVNGRSHRQVITAAEGRLRRSREGLYSTFITPDGRTRIVLLDARFFRTTYSVASPTMYEGTVLGAEQWRWLEKLILRGESPDDDAAGADASRVRAVVVVSGMTVLGETHRHVMAGLAVGEGWRRFPHELARLQALLSSAPLPSVLVSGDVHLAELSEARCYLNAEEKDGDETGAADSAQPSPLGALVEVTSSGLTHSWVSSSSLFRSVIMRTYQAVMPQSFQCATEAGGGDEQLGLAKRQAVHLDLNFGRLELDWNSDAGSPELLAAIHGRGGNVVFSKAWELSSLVGSSTPARTAAVAAARARYEAAVSSPASTQKAFVPRDATAGRAASFAGVVCEPPAGFPSPTEVLARQAVFVIIIAAGPALFAMVAAHGVKAALLKLTKKG